VGLRDVLICEQRHVFVIRFIRKMHFRPYWVTGAMWKTTQRLKYVLHERDSRFAWSRFGDPLEGACKTALGRTINVGNYNRIIKYTPEQEDQPKWAPRCRICQRGCLRRRRRLLRQMQTVGWRTALDTANKKSSQSKSALLPRRTWQ